MKRRGFLGLFGITLAGVGTFQLVRGVCLRDVFLRRLRSDFGTNIADSDAASEFLTDFFADFQKHKKAITETSLLRSLFVARDELIGCGAGAGAVGRPAQNRMVAQFIHSTNVVRVLSGDEASLEYSGLFRPYERPCSNRLSALWI